MASAQSVTLFGNAASPKPTADAWCVFELNSGTNPTVVDSVGVSSVQRVSTGAYRINFSDPAKFSSGAYIAMVQPEFGNASSAYFTCVAQGTTVGNAATASGASASADIVVLDFQPTDTANPSKLQDYNSSTRARVNAAFVCLRSDSDLYNPSKANLIKYSEKYDVSTWIKQSMGTPVAATDVAPPVDVSGASVWKLVPNSNVSYSNSEIHQLTTGMTLNQNGNYTFSAYVRGGDLPSPAFYLYGRNETTAKTFQVGFVPEKRTITPSTNDAASWSGLTGSMKALENGWYRISATAKWIATTNETLSFYFFAGTTSASNADGVKGVYATALQAEYGTVPSKYVKTEATVPVYGNQDQLINLYPSTRGFGASGATYSSSLAQITNKRAASAWGTIVIPPNKGGTVQAYLEGAYNIQGVSAGGNCVFDLYFTKEMGNTGYCVVTSTEQENIFPETNAVGGVQTIPPTYEYTLNLMRNRSAVNDQRTTTGFSITSLRQAETGAAAQRQFTATGATYAYSIGYTQKIHFMVFGGGSSYGTS